MKRKTLVSIFCSTLLLTAGCASAGSEFSDYAGQSLVGEVTAVDGSLAALSLGEYDPDAAADQFQPGMEMEIPSAPAGDQNTAAPESSQQPGSDAPSSAPDGGQEGFDPSAQMNDSGERPELPADAGSAADPSQQGGQDKTGEQPAGQDLQNSQQGAQTNMGQMTMPQNMQSGFSNGFTASGETAIIQLGTAEVKTDADSSSEDSKTQLQTGDIVEITMGSDNKASSITLLRAADTGESMGFDQNSVSGSAAATIDTDGSFVSVTYTSSSDDQNALLIDGAVVTLEKAEIDKAGGASSNTENGDFYGVNAALLAENGAQVTIKDSTVTSSAQNGNGVFSYGESTSITISDSEISTSKDNSGGIMATGGGAIIASNLTVTTQGNSSAAIRTDRGGGSVKVSGGSYASNGLNSPAIYSTADVSVSDADLSAASSEALVIEGENSIDLKNCTVSGNMSDTEGSSSDENVHCVMIYQSMSGDAEEGTA